MNARCTSVYPGHTTTNNNDDIGRCFLPTGHDGTCRARVMLEWNPVFATFETLRRGGDQAETGRTSNPADFAQHVNGIR